MSQYPTRRGFLSRNGRLAMGVATTSSGKQPDGSQRVDAQEVARQLALIVVGVRCARVADGRGSGSRCALCRPC